jgi:hypothetical protein
MRGEASPRIPVGARLRVAARRAGTRLGRGDRRDLKIERRGPRA